MLSPSSGALTNPLRVRSSSVWTPPAPTHHSRHHGGDGARGQFARLLPGTNYFYRVRGGDAVLSDGNVLRTPRTASQPFRFAIIGDWGDGSASMSNIARQVNAIADLDFYLTVGDNIYPGGRGQVLRSALVLAVRADDASRTGVPDARQSRCETAQQQRGAIPRFLPPARQRPGGTRRARLPRSTTATRTSSPLTRIPFDDKKKESRYIAETITDWVQRDLAATHQPWKFASSIIPPTPVPATTRKPSPSRLVCCPLRSGGHSDGVLRHNHFYERTQPIHNIVHIVTGGAARSCIRSSSAPRTLPSSSRRFTVSVSWTSRATG